MPINFPLTPSSGQRYEYSLKAWTWNGTYWQSVGASGSVISGTLGNNAIFSGNIASGSIGSYALASGVGGGSLVLSSGSITSGLIGNNAITSGNIASGQVGRYQINDYNLGILNNTRGGDAGYFAGGYSTAYAKTTDKLTYINDTTAAQTTANLSQAKDSLAGASEGSMKGYFAGGYTNAGVANSVATADKIIFLTNTTVAQTSANLSQARANLTGVSGEKTKGYFAGGLNTSSNYVVTTDKITYSNDTTSAQTSANLSQARRSLAGISEGSTKGYFAGGDTNAAVATAEKLVYSTDTTAAQTSANLSQARRVLAGCSGEGTKGYFAGGYTGAGVSVATTDKLNYSTDINASQASANLSQARYALAGISEGLTKGYFAGGTTNAIVGTADKLTFSNDTNAAQTTAILSQARQTLAAAGQEYSTVFGNSCVFSGNISSSEIGSIHFGFTFPTSGSVSSGEIGDNAITSGNIGSGQITNEHISYFNVGVLDNTTIRGGTQGYFGGGNTTAATNAVSTVDKIIYSTDTTAVQGSAVLQQSRYNLAGVSDGYTKGYFAGGNSGALVYATTNRLTYANDSSVSQTSANLSQARLNAAGCSGEGTKGYFAGGDSSGSANYVATTDKITYSTDLTAAQTTANLSGSRANLAGVSEGSVKGYFAGGFFGSVLATADLITFATDSTAAQTTANLSQARQYLAGSSGEGTKAYFAGGNTSTGNYVTTTDKLTYATDTTVAQTTGNLTQARGFLAGLSQGSSKGYFAGGLTGTSPVTTAEKITYSTDTTTSQTTANLSQARQGLAAAGQEYATAFGDSCVFSGSVSSSELAWFHFISGTFASGGGSIRPSSGSITSGMIGDGAVLSGNIASGSISQFHFSDQSVYSDAIRSGSVSTFKFANQAVWSGEISPDAISTTNLASGGLQSGAFGDNAFASGDILSGRIGNAHIASGELQSWHISSGSINNTKFASGAAVGAYKLADGIVLSGNIASGSIFFTPFDDGAILSGHIASGVIGMFHPADSSVTSGVIPSGTVIFNMVGANATVPNNFADVAFSSGNFALQSVTGQNLADGVWPQPTAFFVSGGITAYMFDNNSINNNNFGWTSLTNAGYFAGGETSAGVGVNTTDKITYLTDTTAAKTTANLQQAKTALAGISEGVTKGYLAVTNIPTDIIYYSTDTAVSAVSANLSQSRSYLAGCSGEGTKGYFVGGNAGANSYVTADKTTYSNDTTAAQTTANLSQARYGLAGISEGSTKGYFAGGTTSTGASAPFTTADLLTYSNDTTAAQTTANLSQARNYLAGCSGDSTKGYFAGGVTGATPTAVVTADKITYSNDTTAAQTTANISQARGGVAGISEGSSKGYFAGGITSVRVVTAENLTYSTDTTAAQTSANLSQGRAYLAGLDGGNAPYIYSPIISSGKLTTTAANEIRFTNMASGSILSGSIVSGVVFSDGTTNNISNAGVASGNIQSGEIARVHLANATILSGNIGSGVINFPIFFGDTTQYANIGSGQIGGVHLGQTIGSNGYFAGGLSSSSNSIPVATTDRVVYSTDTTSAQASANLSQAREFLAGCSGEGTKGYFVGGIGVATADKIVYSTNTTSAQTSANLSQARAYLTAVSNGSTNGYFAGGITSSTPVATAEKLTYSTDTTAAQTTANLSQARYGLAGCSGEGTKGYFVGGSTAGQNETVTTADKITYSTDTTVAQTTANLTQARYLLAGISAEGTKGYFCGGATGGNAVSTTNKITYSTDVTIAQASANLSQARFGLAGCSEGTSKGYFAGGSTGDVVTTTEKLTFSTENSISQASANLSQARRGLAGVENATQIGILPFLASSKLASGTLTLVTASGQNAAFPYNLAETANINTNRPMFDYFRAGELISGIKAVCIGSGNLIRRAERASGLRLPAIGVTSGAILSGTTGRVFYYGYVGQTVSGQVASGFQGQPLYVGSGGFIVNRSGFMGGASSGAPFLSGDMQQSIGVAMSGGLFVMPSPMMIRSGFLGSLPYNMR